MSDKTNGTAVVQPTKHAYAVRLAGMNRSIFNVTFVEDERTPQEIHDEIVKLKSNGAKRGPTGFLFLGTGSFALDEIGSVHLIQPIELAGYQAEVASTAAQGAAGLDDEDEDDGGDEDDGDEPQPQPQPVNPNRLKALSEGLSKLGG